MSSLITFRIRRIVCVFLLTGAAGVLAHYPGRLIFIRTMEDDTCMLSSGEDDPTLGDNGDNDEAGDEVDDYWMFESLSSSSDDDLDDLLAQGVQAPGRPPIIKQFPEIVGVIREFISQHSSAAHDRRREETSYCHGVSAAQIRRHVLQRMPEVPRSLSKTTIRRLLLPPQKGRQAAKRYRGLVAAKLPPKRNDESLKTHADFHYSCAQVNFVSELSSMYADETVALSADDKNKLNVGTLAVSRYFNISKFFMTDDQPNYPDHDFPYSGAKLVPAGYLVLKSKPRRSRSLSPKRRRSYNARRSRSQPPPVCFHSKSHESSVSVGNVYRDELGRERIYWPRTGDLTVYLHASLFHSSTSAMHAAHLQEILQPIVHSENKGAVTIICDGGPDWSTKFTPNLCNYGYLWKSLNLDVLILTCYAPGHSKFNPIEHCWSPLSKMLTGVTLPIRFNGMSPWEHNSSQLSEQEKLQQKGEVLNHAIETCKKYWHQMKYDSFPIKVVSVPCQHVSPLETRHESLKYLSAASARRLRENEDLAGIQEEYQFLLQHCTRKTYQLQFARCKRESCQHCRGSTVRAVKFLGTLEKHNYVLPTPNLNAVHRGHFSTMLEEVSALKPRVLGIDEGMPSLKGKSAPVCPFGCKYVFSSKADADRHCRLMAHNLIRNWRSMLPKFYK